MHFRLVRVLNESLNLAGKLSTTMGFLRPEKPTVQEDSSVLFLCSGNICRSAYAEFKLKELSEREGLSKLEISSAGLRTNNGKDAYPSAIEEAKNRNIDMTQHKTRCVTEEMLDKASVVFVMEPVHKIWLKELSSNNSSNYLGAYTIDAGHPLTVVDPYGRPPEEFVTCFNQIDKACEEIVEEVKKASS